MRGIITLLVVGMLFVSSASAITLLGLPMGPGSKSLDVGYSQTSNLGGQSGATLGTISGSFGIGLMDNLDLIVGYQSGTSNGYNVEVAPGVIMAGTYTQIGYPVLLKYTVMNELNAAPVSVAIGAGVVPFSAKVAVGGGEAKYNGSRAGGGVLVSKIVELGAFPLVPYCNILYTKNGGDPGLSSEIDSAIGSYIPFSKTMGAFVEFSSNSTTPDGGTATTQSAIEADFTVNL